MPAASCLINPPRMRSWWEGTSASAGFSRNVGMKVLDQRIGCSLEAQSVNSRGPWGRVKPNQFLFETVGAATQGRPYDIENGGIGRPTTKSAHHARVGCRGRLV